MRLLHVNAGNLYGGIETMLITMARFRKEAPELEQRFALCFPGRLAEELAAAGTRPEILGPARASRPWTVWRARRALRTLLGRERPDSVACHGTWSFALFGPVARAAGARLVRWAHSPARGPAWLERLAALVRPDLVVANSHYTAEGPGGRFPGAPVEVLYPPVAPPPPGATVERDATRATVGAAADQVVLLAASRLERLKGLHLLVEALRLMRDQPRWVCWIAGGAQHDSERRYLAEIQEACRAGGIADRVRFLGERRDVRTLMAAADVFVQANVEPDAFGITLVEAMYAGLPVVTTAIGGALEVLGGVVGRLVRADAEDVSRALTALVLDDAVRVGLAGAAPGRAASLCDPGERLRALCAMLTGPAGAPGRVLGRGSSMTGWHGSAGRR